MTCIDRRVSNRRLDVKPLALYSREVLQATAADPERDWYDRQAALWLVKKLHPINGRTTK